VSPLFWLSLGIALVVGFAAIALVVVRAIELYRSFRDATRILAAGTARIMTAAATAEQRAAGVGTERLKASVAQLERSLAEARILLREARRVQGVVGAVTGLLPRK
jgi:hypothetical protein